MERYMVESIRHVVAEAVLLIFLDLIIPIALLLVERVERQDVYNGTNTFFFFEFHCRYR